MLNTSPIINALGSIKKQPIRTIGVVVNQVLDNAEDNLREDAREAGVELGSRKIGEIASLQSSPEIRS